MRKWRVLFWLAALSTLGPLVLGLALLWRAERSAHSGEARALLEGRAKPELVARRDYLEQRLGDVWDQLTPGDDQFQGEWVLVTLSMTSLAATNIAFAHPETLPDARRVVRRCLELAKEPRTRGFDSMLWNGEDALETLAEPAPHIGYLGHLAIILEAQRVLGDAPDALEEPVIAALARRYTQADFPYLMTYPGQRYTADNMVAMAAVALSDIGRPPRQVALLAHYIAYTRRLVDEDSGLVAFTVTRDGELRTYGRGSGVGWNAIYLPFIDEPFALEQTTRLRTRMTMPIGLGLSGICEFDLCAQGFGDVDSGPLLFGVSPAGTGFGIAAARRSGDAAWLAGLLATAESFGFSFEWAGKRRYLTAPLVGDASVLAAKTSVAWDARFLEAASTAVR